MQTLTREIKNKIQYINFIIIGFARGFKMLIPESYGYLDKYGGLDFLYKHYEYEHTQSKHHTLMAMLEICRKNGGWL